MNNLYNLSTKILEGINPTYKIKYKSFHRVNRVKKWKFILSSIFILPIRLFGYISALFGWYVTSFIFRIG